MMKKPKWKKDETYLFVILMVIAAILLFSLLGKIFS
ncbi:hypothetical protein EDD68_103187 [Melghiribacillus thermohalophilus]|uniref:DUF4044 domain-containing protein n=1 Tax=Melghiribacillus thermohalophilus TaxID=1324956 RepID=A0A4R3NEI8_9BACI|nr:hypothetical protein EDD68_103187 [Melghiribacillus thermohalophilus]